MTHTIVAEIKARAAEIGFVACGISDLSPTAHGKDFDRWIANGYAGNMRYLHRQARKRKDPSRIAPEGRSLVVVLDNYYYDERPQAAPKVARYAQGRDYHRVTGERLETLATRIRALGAAYTRIFTDAGPVPEREVAQRAGLGWIGKNCMLIRPGVGSWFFIGSILTDLALPADQPFTTDHCGSCRRCLDACPTDAFVEPGVLDATRCISYQTIEKTGPIDPFVVPHLEGWGFGCDICNEVCPWNERFAVPTSIAEFRPREDTPAGKPDAFAQLDEAEFDRRFGDTPFERAGLEKMQGNWKAAVKAQSANGR